MIQQRFSRINIALVASLVFFLLVVALWVNYRIGALLGSIEDDLVADLERASNLRIEYDSLELDSFDSILIRGVRVQHGDFGRDAPLVRVDSARIAVRPLQLVFGGDSPVECISAIEISKPVVNFYSDVSLLSAISAATQGQGAVLRDEEKAGAADKPVKLNCTVRVDQGMVRVFGEDSRRQIAPAAPLVEIRLPRGEIDIKDNRGNFKIASGFDVLPGQNAVRGLLELAGIFDLDRRSLDALIETKEVRVGGIRLPELRFFVAHEDGNFSVDSSTFNQAVSIDGRYKTGARGKFVLNLDEKLAFFDSFIEQNVGDTLAGMFFPGEQRYTPKGQMLVELAGDTLKVDGDLSIRDGSGNDVLRLQASGDEKFLTLHRLELSRGAHLIDIRGYWDWHGMPRLSGQLRQILVGSMAIDANWSLEPATADAVRLRAGNIVVNGRPLGDVAVEYDTAGGSLDVNGFGGTLRGQGSLSGGEKSFNINLAGFDLGAVALALDAGKVFDGWLASGEASVTIGSNDFRVESSLAIGTPGLGMIKSALSFDGERLEVRDFSVAGTRLSGDAHIEYDGVRADMKLVYGDREYPLAFALKRSGNFARANLDITGLAQIRADVEDGQIKASANIIRLDLAPLGINGSLSGDLTTAWSKDRLLTGGSLGVALVDPGPLSLAVVFHGVDRRFDLTTVACAWVGGRLEGGGTVKATEDDDWSVALAFANGISLDGIYGKNGASGKVRLQTVDLATLAPGLAAGIADGNVEVTTDEFAPRLEWNLSVRDGKIDGVPFALKSSARLRDNGFREVRAQASYGDFSLAIRNGTWYGTARGQEYSLDGQLDWNGSGLKTRARLNIQGSMSGNNAEALLLASDVRVNGQQNGSLSSLLRFDGRKLELSRRGSAGLEGVVDLAREAINIRYLDTGGARVSLAGEYGQRLDLAAVAEKIPLRILENLPGFFRNVAGRLSGAARIRGTQEAPDIVADLKVSDGEMEIPVLSEPLTRLSLAASLSNNVLQIAGLTATNGKGGLTLSGKVFARDGKFEDLSVRLRTDRKYGLAMNLQDPEIRSKGGALADIFISGKLHAPTVQGRVAMHDNEFYYLEDSSIPSRENLIKRINWDLEVSALEGVSYVNPLLTGVMQPGTKVRLYRTIIDRSFQVSGKVPIIDGSINYVNYEFRIIQPTYVEFKQTKAGIDPQIEFRSRLQIKDEDNEDIDIFLSFSGSLLSMEEMKPVFTSDPPRSEKEIRVLLGIEQPEKQTADGRRSQENMLLRSTELLSSLGLKPLTREIKRFLGLDIFEIRTPLVRNIIEHETSTNIGIKQQSIFRDTEFSLGKYLTDFMFVEYTFKLKADENAENIGTVLPTHQVGLEFSFDFLNLGYMFKPTEESGYSEYEHGIEVRFRQRF